MPLNIGYIHVGDIDCYVRIFYNSTFVPSGAQTFLDAPLINNSNPALGPTGYCLLVVNLTGRPQKATVKDKNGVVLVNNVTIITGNPVTNGAGRSRTAAQLASAGFTKRGDVGEIIFQ